MHSPIDDVYM